MGTYPLGYEHFFLGQLLFTAPPLGAMSWMLDILPFYAFTTFYHAYVTYGQETFGRLIDSFVTRTVDVFLLPLPLSLSLLRTTLNI